MDSAGRGRKFQARGDTRVILLCTSACMYVFSFSISLLFSFISLPLRPCPSSSLYPANGQADEDSGNTPPAVTTPLLTDTFCPGSIQLARHLSLSLSYSLALCLPFLPPTSVTRTKVSTHTVNCRRGKDNVKASLCTAHRSESSFKDKANSVRQ